MSRCARLSTRWPNICLQFSTSLWLTVELYLRHMFVLSVPTLSVDGAFASSTNIPRSYRLNMNTLICCPQASWLLLAASSSEEEGAISADEIIETVYCVTYDNVDHPADAQSWDCE